MAAKGQPKTGGRKAGSLNKATSDIKALAQDYTVEAFEGLLSVLRSDDSPAAAKVSAAKEILDRGHGKPSQAVDLNTQMKHEDWLDLLNATDEKPRA